MSLINHTGCRPSEYTGIDKGNRERPSLFLCSFVAEQGRFRRRRRCRQSTVVAMAMVMVAAATAAEGSRCVNGEYSMSWAQHASDIASRLE